MTEFDYRNEANNLRSVANNIAPLYGHLARVPLPVEHLCTRDVLVMEYVPGVKLADGIRAHVRRSLCPCAVCRLARPPCVSARARACSTRNSRRVWE